MIPHYWAKAQTFLSHEDPIMARLIERYPDESLRNRGNSFQTLLRAIVGQQISVKAADSVWLKLETIAEEITVENLKLFDIERLKEAGLSRQKACYVQNITLFYSKNGITDNHWNNQNYEKTREELISIKGVGQWTVEMFAIFYLHEPDIFSSKDIGIQKAISQLYFEGKSPQKETLEQFSEKWKPYRTVALWYLWRHLDPEPISY